jgi:hypothetical protein
MAFERTFQNFAGRWAPPRGAESEATGGDGNRQASGSNTNVRGEPSQSEWGIILEQASELNDELCRENCDLHREVAVLRERRAKRLAAADVSANGAAQKAVVNASWAKEITPRVTSHVRRSLQQLNRVGVDADGSSNASIQHDKELLQLLEDAVRKVLLAAAEGVRGSEAAALASSEETATLIQEKLMLKEMSLMNSERLLELEFARDKLSGGTQGSQWAQRLLSNVLQGNLTDAAVVGGTSSMPANSMAVPTIERPPESAVAVGSQLVVVGKKGAILRETVDLESEKVVTLPPGSHVRILELGTADSRRAKVLTLSIAGGSLHSSADAGEPDPEAPRPVEASTLPGEDATTSSSADAAHVGWLSMTTKDGKALLRPADAHEAIPPASAQPVESSNAESGQDQVIQTADSETAGECDDSRLASSPLASGSRDGRRPSEEAALPEVSFSKDQSTVTVSTDCWLALRQERQQREQQIRALELQVAAARREIQQLAEIRAQLRSQRAVALDMRRKGSELQEAALMSAEELRSLRALDLALRQELGPEPSSAEEHALLEDTNQSAEDSQQSLHADDFVATETDDSAATEEEMKRALEWRRLMSERETTAHELAFVLRRTEELESVFEDRRIELQAAEKRRDRERRSLLTALRELDWQGGSAADNSDGDQDGTAEAAEVASRSDSEMTTTKYIQRISEIEDHLETLQLKLDAVQAREAVLNNLAVVRGEALRYAATAAGTSMEAALVASRTSKVRRSASLEEYFQLAPSSDKHRAELDGLANLLEGLFVENYALRSEVLAGNAASSSAAAEATTTSQTHTTPNVDLSNFIKSEEDASDDDDNCSRQGGPVDSAREAGSADRHDDTAPLTPRHSECWPDSPRSLPSPRLLLAESITALDFTDMSVAEA